MSIGKKIGGGFLIVLALTSILGLWAIYSMDKGANVTEEIEDDRLPRLIYWGDAQSDLLEAAYYARVYFETGNEENLKKTYGYITEYSENIKHLSDLNAKVYYETTAKALTKAEKDIAAYRSLIETNETLYKRSEQLVRDMGGAVTGALESLQKLIGAIGASIDEALGTGDARLAEARNKNLLAAQGIYARIGEIYQSLLVAERNNDLASFTNIEGKIPQIRKDAQSIDSGLSSSSGHKTFADAMAAFQNFVSVSEQAAAGLREHLKIGQERYKLYLEMYQDTVAMVELTTTNTKKFATSAVSILNGSTMAVAILLVIIILLGLGVAIIITRLIVKPLGATQQFAMEVAGGNLDEKLHVQSTDETGKLADALREMVDALKQNINQARQKSEQALKATEEAKNAMGRAEEAARKAENAKREGMLAAAAQLEGMVEIISSASTQLSAQIEQSDRGATESAQRLQEAATAMNEMNATVQEVARNAGSASEASSETREKAVAGQHVVQQVVESIGEVHNTSLQLKNDMAQLNDRAQDINRIMGVISDIADQTNLLALNAAIEAARAGEAGRGFAVVADEVRKLAEKTMTSTLDVSNAIRAIQESTNKSMEAVDNAVVKIGQATGLANQSGAALEEIVATVEATTDQVQAIAAASEEQSAASEEINRSITEVNDMSRLTADAMGEATQAVSDLASQANKLTSLIQQMKNS